MYDKLQTALSLRPHCKGSQGIETTEVARLSGLRLEKLPPAVSLRDAYEEVESRNLYEAVLSFRTGHIAIGKCAPQTDVRYRSERDLPIVKKHLISKPVDDGAWNCRW
jgi:hypothetical protein